MSYDFAFLNEGERQYMVGKDNMWKGHYMVGYTLFNGDGQYVVWGDIIQWGRTICGGDRPYSMGMDNINWGQTFLTYAPT